MTTYSVHLKDGGEPDEVTLVPEGFNARALIFTVLWALWNRMWVVAGLFLALVVSVAVLGSSLGLAPEVVALLQFGLSLLLGYEANDLRRMSLTQSGYDEVALVGGSSLAEAELRYFANTRSSSGVAASVPASIQFQHDTLGLFGNV